MLRKLTSLLDGYFLKKLRLLNYPIDPDSDELVEIITDLYSSSDPNFFYTCPTFGKANTVLQQSFYEYSISGLRSFFVSFLTRDVLQAHNNIEDVTLELFNELASFFPTFFAAEKPRFDNDLQPVQIWMRTLLNCCYMVQHFKVVEISLDLVLQYALFQPGEKDVILSQTIVTSIVGMVRNCYCLELLYCHFSYGSSCTPVN